MDRPALAFILLSTSVGWAQMKVHFASEQQSTIKVTVDSHEETARIWSAPADLDVAGHQERFDVLSIATPDKMLWWSLEYNPDSAPGHSLAEFDNYHRCIADGRFFRCFISLVFNDILVRTCIDKVSDIDRQRYLISRVSEVQNPGAWALLKSFDKISIHGIDNFSSLHESGEIGRAHV